MKKIQHFFAGINFKAICLNCLFLISVSTAFSQQEVAALQQQFENYTSTNYQEKVFLHTDKSVYATGELLWFKCYLTSAATNNFSLLSSICYVEVISEDKRPLLQAKVDIDSGRGSGSILIPSSIHTGNYIIRAYTSWMKNFDAAFYFEQTISIINPNKKVEKRAIDTVTNSTVQFFPEGGNLVYGLTNNVAFKVIDVHGRGIAATGAIVDQKNTVIVNFESAHAGMGSFGFDPVAGNTYHAVIKLDNKTITQQLPKIYNTGWALQVKTVENNIVVNVTSNIETARQVFLFVQTRNTVKLAAAQFLNKGVASFTISRAALDDGISQLTIFNDAKQPVCERLYFKRPAQLQIKLADIPSTIDLRKKVSVSISTVTVDGQNLNAEMSAAVYLTDSLQPLLENNVLNYLWLSSELKGTVESPQYYFENTGAEADQATDNLMLVNGWRRFKWEAVLLNERPSFTFLPEHEGHVITGMLTPKIASLPVGDIPAYLSVPGKNFKFVNTASSATGNVKFDVQKFYGSHEIIVQTSLADTNYRVFIDNPFSEKYSETSIGPFSLQPALANNILLRTIGAQAQGSYQPEKKAVFNLPSQFDTTAFFSLPSKTYRLDDYTRFPTMEEVMREYVNEVHVRTRQKKFYYEVLNGPEKNFFADEPLVLIDGVPVFDVDKIIDIDPLKIRKIDIVTNKFFQGRQQYNGIVSYATYDDDLDGYQLDPNSLVIEYEGLQLEREFYSPQYETAQQTGSRTPDYRNVLYWSPGIQTGNGKQGISFYTSDVPGKYVVVIQGISDSGLAGVAVSTFTVLPSSNK